MSPPRTYLTDEDIRFELRFMIRWCRLFQKTALDWVNLEAKRFRDRHPCRATVPTARGEPLSAVRSLR